MKNSRKHLMIMKRLLKKLRIWINTQIITHKRKTNIMKNTEIYTKWFEFVNDNKYNQYFISNKNK